MIPTFELSQFQKERQKITPRLPKMLQAQHLTFTESERVTDEGIKKLFPSLAGSKYVEFRPSQTVPEATGPLRVGVVLSGGQAPGGHNVIAGVYDFIKQYHAGSQLFGFLQGPKGIFTNKFAEITEEVMNSYRNMGGFDMICAGRDKIETEEQFLKSGEACKNLKLDGLVVIGGDDSNTNAAVLAEYFLKNGIQTKVVGAPKTIDGDLKNDVIEVSFGFDTATKTYSECIGNIMLDTLSTKKYYHFIRLMGRSASHIALECALQTHPTHTIICEEVAALKQTCETIVNELADIVCKRGAEGKNYGVILLPEGLVEFIPEIKVLISELNEQLHKMNTPAGEVPDEQQVAALLTEASRKCFTFLPDAIRRQLLLDRDPHGNVQVAKIETERLLMLLLETELKKRNYQHKFTAHSHYFGYEGRSCPPSPFDTEYCYALGKVAGALILNQITGCMAVLRGLHSDVSEWIPAGCPLISMMNVERRKGKDNPVIKKMLTELNSPCFLAYKEIRQHWQQHDCFRSPGPIQFEVGKDKVNFLTKPPTAEDLSRELPVSNVPYAPKAIQNQSPLAIERMNQPVELPHVLSGLNHVTFSQGQVLLNKTEEARTEIGAKFPNLITQRNFLEISPCLERQSNPINIGVVFSGRQAPGGHNIIDGLLSAVKSRPGSKLYGFLEGTLGLFSKSYIEVTEEDFKMYRNQGGFDFLGRSVDQIRTEEQVAKTKATCTDLKLDGLVVIGATHTLTDVALLAENFKKSGHPTRIIGVPCTLDNNVQHDMFEQCVGFDTASKVYGQLIGNMMTDSASAIKYWYFIRLMGRDPSHLVLECALNTKPNGVVISEQVSSEGLSLKDVVAELANIVEKRASQNKLFGAILIPEGLLVHLPHIKELIEELNKILVKDTNLGQILAEDDSQVDKYLDPIYASILKSFPKFFRQQLLLERESHGTIQLTQLQTEKLLADLVANELKERKKKGTFKASFAPVTHFFGYQGRSSFPTIFDCTLASTYGYIAAALIDAGYTGYIPTARGLTGPVTDWRLGALPISSMMVVKGKSQYGTRKPLVPSVEVSVTSHAFFKVQDQKNDWILGDRYSNPGPIQFSGAFAKSTNLSLIYNQGSYLELLKQIENLCSNIKRTCRFGVGEQQLRAAVTGLSGLEEILKCFGRE